MKSFKWKQGKNFWISIGSLFHVTGPRYLIFLCLIVVLTDGMRYPDWDIRVLAAFRQSNQHKYKQPWTKSQGFHCFKSYVCESTRSSAMEKSTIVYNNFMLNKRVYPKEAIVLFVFLNSPNSPTPAMPRTMLAWVGTGFRHILATITMTMRHAGKRRSQAPIYSSRRSLALEKFPVALWDFSCLLSCGHVDVHRQTRVPVQ